MITRYVLYTLLWLIATIVGIFGGYHLVRYKGIGESIWGDSVDGYCGDFAYKAKEGQAWFRKYWACWWWSAVRNPCHNLLTNKLCAEGEITKIEHRSRNLTIVTLDYNKRYFFYFNQGSKYVVKFGWKFWSNEIKVGQYYRAAFVLNP